MAPSWQPPNWFIQYWHILREEIFRHDQRREILTVLVEMDAVVFSRGYLIDKISERLQEVGTYDEEDRYSDQQFNEVIKYFEATGLVERPPEWGDNTNSVIFRNRNMLEEWLSKQEFKLDAPVQPLPDTAKSVTHYLGRTQTKTNPTTRQNQNLETVQPQVSQPEATDQRYDIGKDNLHWSPHPLEAKIYALTVGQEAYVSNPAVNIEAGEYMELSDDAKALLQEELDFDINLPATENGPEPEQYFPYTHDYAIVGVLRSLQQVPQHSDLKTAILSQLISWVSGAIEIYARTRQATDDETEPAVDSELLHAREDELPAWGSNHITASRDGNVVSDLGNEQLLFGVYVRDRVRKKSELQESNDDEGPPVDTPDEPKSTDSSPEPPTNQSNQ